MEEFPKFKPIPRLNRDMVITEKIDGTNGLILIQHTEKKPAWPLAGRRAIETDDGWLEVQAGSRSRWITPDEDNFGFSSWVLNHAEQLVLLGAGLHYGEWWGSGIQRGYGLQKGEKRFSLFNTGRWNEANTPECVNVVPVLYSGPFVTTAAEIVMEDLRRYGSMAAPGFMKPEGVVIYHTHANSYFKATLEKDELPKTLAKAG